MDTEEALKMLEKTGKIDSIGKNPAGWIIDLYNDRLKRSREKTFNQQVADMNHYYINLIMHTMKSRAEGEANPVYKSNSIMI